jgi:hypothetical protein
MLRKLGVCLLLISGFAMGGWGGNRMAVSPPKPPPVIVRPFVCPSACDNPTWHRHCNVLPWNACDFDNNPCNGCDKCIPGDCGDCFCG